MSVLAAVLLAAGGALPPPTQPPVRYTVVQNDTLIALARRWFVRTDGWPDVQKLNRVSNPLHLRVGSTLAIPRELLRSEPVGARVVAFRGAATVAGKPVRIGSTVVEGAEIATGTDASITVECSDGSRFSLPSQTRVGVARLRKIVMTGDVDRVFATVHGRGEWRVTPATTPDSRFIVTTPVSVSAVRGTGFRVGYDGTAAVGVIEGKVGVGGSDPATMVAIAKGQGVAINGTGVGAPVKLLTAPLIVKGGATQAKPELAFRIEPVAGAQSYVFEVGTDAGLIDRVRELRGADVTATLPGLPDGSYFIRATATDPKGIDGFATTVAFERLSFGAAPPEKFGRGMRFRWLSGEPAAPREFRFSLYSDEAGTRALIDRPGLTANGFTVTDLKPGTYWWRVTMTKFGGPNGAVVAAGDLQSFTIEKP